MLTLIHSKADRKQQQNRTSEFLPLWADMGARPQGDTHVHTPHLSDPVDGPPSVEILSVITREDGKMPDSDEETGVSKVGEPVADTKRKMQESPV